MTLTDASGRPVGLDKKLGAGGEADIFGVSGNKDQVAKIYFTATAERAAKLAAMVSTPPADPTIGQGHVSICWPQTLLFNGARTCAGFLMHRVDFSTNVPVLKLYNPQDRQEVAPGFTWGYLLRAAINISSVVESIHSCGYVLGDLNESNFLVSDRALVTLVDCDSMQVPKSGGGFFRCTVGKPDFTAPELQGTDFSHVDRQPAHDNFALGVMIFHLLMEGVHPFSGVWQGEGDAPLLEERIKAGECVYAGSNRFARMPAAVPFEILPASVRSLVVRCFGYGHKSPATRPSAREWRDVLNQVDRSLTKCPANDRHVYANHLAQCPWCERTTLLGGWDPYGSKPLQKPMKPARFVSPAPSPSRPTPASAPRPAPTPTPIRPSTPSPSAPITPRKPYREPLSIWQVVKAGILGALLLNMSGCTLMGISEAATGARQFQNAPWTLIGFVAGAGFRLLMRISRQVAYISAGAFVICTMGLYHMVMAPAVTPRRPVVANVPVPNVPINAIDTRWRTFVVDTRIDVTFPNGQRCSLMPGDVLTRHPNNATRGDAILLLIQKSKSKACPVGSSVLIEVAALQRMHARNPQPAVALPPPTPVPAPAPPPAPTRPPPSVIAFEAADMSSDPCPVRILRWTITGATIVSIDNGIGAVDPSSGYINIRPLKTTRYTLTAKGAGPTVTRNVTVLVSRAAAIACRK